MSAKKPILLDGAVGTSLWEKTEDRSPVWIFNIEKPDIVRELYQENIEAGSKIILANTFGANRTAVSQNSSYTVKEVVQAGVRLATEAVKGTDVKVALSAGPLFQLMEPYGELSEEEVADFYREQLGAGMELPDKPDLIMLQTFLDAQMMRVAATVAKEFGVPVFCTLTFEKNGYTMMGNSVQDVIDILTPVGIDAIGMNCSLGPDMALPIIKEFAEKSPLPVIFKPNAGIQTIDDDGNVTTPYSAADFVAEIAPALPHVDYIGGCCGSNASYIKALGEAIEKL